MPVRLRLFADLKSNRPRYKSSAFFAGSDTLGFESFELGAGLFAIADSVIGAERHLLAAGKQEFLAALHEILLVERPRVHEVLQHNHDHVAADILDGQTFW